MQRSIAVICMCAFVFSAGAGDNNVEWDTLSHEVQLDLRPMVPVGGESFDAQMHAIGGDLTSARVGYWEDGVFGSWIDAAVIGVRGPYDIWSAPIPSSGSVVLSYVFEVTDGTDTDYLGNSGPAESIPSNRFVVNFDTLEHARLGATPVAGGTVFKVWSPTRSTCHVRGEFNGWSTANPLSKVGEHFIGFIAGAQTGDMYKYFFNNVKWSTDPHASSLNTSDNMNAVITDPLAYQWQHDDFVAAPLDEWVVYQLHVGTFAGRNDPMGPTANPSQFRDVGDRADHLAELGINAVMINPINEFPGSFSGGYNPISMFAWESALGGPDDLKYMVDELHERGIAVVLDVIWNHFSPSDNFLWDYDGTQIYFDSPAQDTPWGAQADFDRAGVFEYFVESVHHVMGEFRMDGYRQDAVMAMTDSNWTSQWSSGQDLMREMNRTIRRRYVDANSIAEIYIDNPWVHTGIEFDTQYHNSFKNSLRDATFGAAFGSPNINNVAQAVDGTGSVRGTEVLNYFELHDDAWPLNGHERAVKEIDPSFPNDDMFARGRTTVAQSIVMFASGIPAILQGTEWLENDGWEENKIDWSHKTTYSHIFDFYKAAIALRTNEAALFADSNVWVYHINESADVFAFERWVNGGESFVIVINFSDSDYNNYRVGLPRSGSWGIALNNQDLAFGGSGFGTSGVFDAENISNGPHAQSVALSIPARGVLVLEHEPAAECAADIDGDGSLNFFDISAFLSLFSAQDPQADFTGDGSFNFFDISAFLSAFSAGCP